MSADTIALILGTIVTAATPLALAALGELVTERAGILNLGVEGMMIMGAAVGFAAAFQTGSLMVGAIAGMLAGMALAAVFALLVLFFATNQVGSGLALTILGLGLSGLVGEAYVGQHRERASVLHVPGLSDIPFVGPLFFGQDAFVYLTVALTAAVAWFLKRTRAGLVLRAVGDNNHSAHAIGISVRGVQFAAILFGGACAGLAGAYLSLVYTPFWSPGMTSGRGWIALALVVFASWQPWRVVLGALLFGGATMLQLHAQAASIGIPGQVLSALPYLATLLALVALSLKDRQGSTAPAALGKTFIPDR
jgi:ABC-type uncharacterized transport system permease subunit